jgi:hypothetical protein
VPRYHATMITHAGNLSARRNVVASYVPANLEAAGRAEGKHGNGLATILVEASCHKTAPAVERRSGSGVQSITCYRPRPKLGVM